MPFYVHLTHACPEDLDGPKSKAILHTLLEINRSIFDFLQWKHPVSRVARRKFVKSFFGSRIKQSSHEKNFFLWREQCWKNWSSPDQITPHPPYRRLFPVVIRILDEEYEKYFINNIISEDDLTWFQNNAIREGDDYLEEEEIEEYLRDLMADADSHMANYRSEDMLEYAVDAPTAYSYLTYGDNTDPLDESFDETADEEMYADFEE